MRLVVDANILVAELLRKRGRALVADKRLELFIAAKAMEEALYELVKRIDIIAERSGASTEDLSAFLEVATRAAKDNFLTIESEAYQAFEIEARMRIPRDADDWHTVALALSLGAAIWTQDNDFLGCGVATWTTETLRLKLA